MALEADPFTLTWSQVHAFRLRRHRLDRRASRRDLAAVVGAIGGVQTQVYSAAQLALRARVEGLTPEDVDRALWRDVALVKTWSIRGTLHLIPARDYGLYAAALRPVAARERRWIVRSFAPEDPEEIVATIRKVLASGRLTRKELTERVVAIAGPKLRASIASGWGGLPKLASVQGYLCQGPGEGQEVTFVLAEDWIPDLEPVEVEAAEEELARRYLAAYGPATVQDYTLWSGIAVQAARRVWARMRDELVAVRIDSRAATALRADLRELSRGPRDGTAVRLLPNFDSYLLGTRDKSHLVDAKHYKRVYRKAGWLSPVVLVDGRAAGVWSSKKRGGGWRISVDLFGAASREVRAGIKEEAGDIGRFLGGDATVAYA